jgi:predicted ATPase
MNIALTGSHRVGKTTLARAFAEAANIAFLQTGVSEVFALLGKDPSAVYPVEERLAIQEAILLALEQQYAHASAATPVFIADRCPLDLAAYMVADVQRNTLAGEPALAAMVNDYVRRCIESTNRWFATVLLVQPGIALVEASGKALACPAYIEHLNLTLGGLLVDERLHTRHYLIPRRFIKLEQRVACVRNAVAHAVTVTEKLHSQSKQAGIRLH